MTAGTHRPSSHTLPRPPQVRPGRRSPAEIARERLLLADGIERILGVLRDVAARTPGLGRAVLFVVDPGGEPEPLADLDGPRAREDTVPALELRGLARRAVRERGPVERRGVPGPVQWAVPLGPAGRPEAVVVAVGDGGDLRDLLPDAGLALARERHRAADPPRGQEARAADLERAVAVLDAIAREGGTGAVQGRIAAALARTPGIGRVTLWALRPEDGVYLAVADAGGAEDAATRPGPPPARRRAEELRDWLAGLPRWAGLAWVPAGPARAARPTPGDLLLAPLGEGERPHALGIVALEIDGPLVDGSLEEDVQRWAVLARLALESVDDVRGHRRRVEALREERDRLAEVHRLKSQFIAAVSHELRTPLTSIAAYAETLRSPDLVPDDVQRDRFLRVIQDESRRLTRIVDDILDLATVDAGHVRLSCGPTRLGDVVHAALDVMRPLADDKGVTIATVTGSDAVVHADPDLLKQLVVNLLENGVKFTPAGGRVEVRTECDGTAARLVVEDDGPGIPADRLDRIFDRFYRIDGSRARRHGGSGLGLSICRSITTWHDGRIWAESDLGQGTRFVVSLPRARATSLRRAAAPPIVDGPTPRPELPELLIEMISELMGAETVSLMLLDRGRRELHVQAAIGLSDEAIRDARIAVGERIAGSVAESGETLLVPDVAADDRFPAASWVGRYRTRSLVSVPVRVRGEVHGVLNVTNSASGRVFDDDDRRLLEILAERVALILTKLREEPQAVETRERIEEALRGVIDARRHYFPDGEAYARLVLDVCATLGLDADASARVRYAALLRDVGMVRLPEGVYRKPVPLTDRDRERVRRHPEEGARVLRPIEFRPDIFDIILAHHEEPAGTGYPRGLSEKGIPLGARILAVLDAWHALRLGRPWREAVEETAALEELRRHTGTQFDPEVVEALVRVLETHRNRGRP